MKPSHAIARSQSGDHPQERRALYQPNPHNLNALHRLQPIASPGGGLTIARRASPLIPREGNPRIAEQSHGALTASRNIFAASRRCTGGAQGVYGCHPPVSGIYGALTFGVRDADHFQLNRARGLHPFHDIPHLCLQQSPRQRGYMSD